MSQQVLNFQKPQKSRENLFTFLSLQFDEFFKVRRNWCAILRFLNLLEHTVASVVLVNDSKSQIDDLNVYLSFADIGSIPVHIRECQALQVVDFSSNPIPE